MLCIYMRQGLILELLLRACSIPMAASDLVWNHGLLIWLAQVTRCVCIITCIYLDDLLCEKFLPTMSCMSLVCVCARNLGVCLYLLLCFVYLCFSDSTIVLQILSELCRVLGTAAVLGQGVEGGGDCSSRQTVKPPPLLEEELTLTASRVVTSSCSMSFFL